MRKYRLWIVAIVALLAAACGGGDGESADTATEEAGGGEQTTATEAGTEAAAGGEVGDATFGLSLSTLNNPFFVTLRDGAQAAADEVGAELLVADAQDDAQTQANDIQDFITRGVDVVLINPVDSAAVTASVEAANSAGIPVVTVDRSAEGGEVASHVASDNVQGARDAANYLFEQIGGSGPVAMLEGVPGTSAARDRGEGFQEAVDATDGIEVVATQSANFNREEGFTVTQNILQANPELAGLFAQNDTMALGAVEAASQTGAEELVIVGFDAIDEALQAIQDGSMAATVAQRPAEIGRIGVETAADLLAGEQVEAEQPVEVELVTPDNVDQFTGG